MEPEALSTVFTAAIKAIEARCMGHAVPPVPPVPCRRAEAELRSGGGLDTSQRKFLRETYSNAGREEERCWMVMDGDGGW